MATKTTSTSSSSTSDPVLGPLLRAERFHHFYHIQQHLPLLRPKFCIRRPNNQMVPLIAMDELPHWLLVITNYPLASSDMELVAPNRQVPRLGEYGIICLFCESSLHHVADDISWHRSKMRDLDQYQDALLGRRYPPYVYPSSYYEDARSLHHYEAFAATTASDSQCSGGSTLNPEASEFRPGSNRLRMTFFSAETRSTLTY